MHVMCSILQYSSFSDIIFIKSLYFKFQVLFFANLSARFVYSAHYNGKEILILMKKITASVASVALIAVAVCAAFTLKSKLVAPSESPSIITVSTLENIIDRSQLSTFSAVYNGIAEVKSDTNPEQVDFYVAYEAKVSAGIDLDKIQYSENSETKTLIITLPDVYINDTNVDIASMDFIFNNKKLNQSTISAQAFKACEDDAREESSAQTAIYELAQQNAVNAVTALTKPIVNQLDSSYTLVVK